MKKVKWTKKDEDLYNALPVYFSIEIWRKRYENLFGPSEELNAAYAHLALTMEYAI